MSLLGRIIFMSMVCLILIFAFFITLILIFAFSNASFGTLSSDRIPVANLGQDHVLSCYLPNTIVTKLSVTWAKLGESGVVYQYSNGAPILQDQNSQFRGRTELFPDALVNGNASLRLRTARRSDEGEYTCTISSSAGGGKVSISLRTAAYTAPTFTHVNNTLIAQANRWSPKPNVTWFTIDQDVLQGSTYFSEASNNIYSVVSTLQTINNSGNYLCKIENDLVLSTSIITSADSDVSVTSYFTYSDAPPVLLSAYLNIIPFVFCVCYLT
ncbi:V-set domain containing T-cell activation inhibitor 1 [Cynoglossus semilaevis]|uniref:V-set domain containing T-cell activation inhibitor 1 n=1 Tax=Cynoglossus semilaevis TaxID=244447 RepID=A0A3P8UUU2_CYNSE|nr:V-set domain containing T-cell activation inhibitor 1 [Cynoglossus semilaevis]